MNQCVRCLKPLSSARSSMCDECRQAAGLPPLSAARPAGAFLAHSTAPSSFLEISDTPLPSHPPAEPEPAPSRIAPEPQEPDEPPAQEIDYVPLAHAAPPPPLQAAGPVLNPSPPGWELSPIGTHEDLSATQALKLGFAGLLQAWILDIKLWAGGRSWFLRVPVVVYIAWAGYVHLADSTAGDLTSWPTALVRWFAQVLTCWLPPDVCSGAGVLAVLLLPILLGVHFLRQRDYFAVTVAVAWLSFGIFQIAQDSDAAALLRFIAALVLLKSLVGGVWICYLMIRYRGPAAPQNFR